MVLVNPLPKPSGAYSAGLDLPPYFLAHGKTNNFRVPAYHRLDIAYRLRYVSDQFTFCPYIELINVYNRKNILSYSYDFMTNPAKVDKNNQLPFLPSSGLYGGVLIMKKQIIIPVILILFLLLGLIGCDNSDQDVYVKEVALEGTLYINQPLSIRLSYTVPIEQHYDPAEQAVHGADVRITAGDSSTGFTTYILPEDTTRPGWYTVADPSVLATTGTHYSIVVQTLDGHNLTAETVGAAPLRIRGVLYQGIHDDSLHVDTCLFRDSVNVDTLESSGTFFYVVGYNTDPVHNAGYNLIIENLDIEQGFVSDWKTREVSTQSMEGGLPIAAQMERSDDFIQIMNVSLPYWGRIRVRAYSCDEAWWNYVYTTRLGTADNYPQSNVTGGYGVFSAIGADTAYFYLVDRISDE